MSARYTKPDYVTYDRTTIQEWMGPVKTQYAPPPPPPCDSCGVNISPASILQSKVVDNFTVTVATGGCTEFQRVQVTIPGSQPFVFQEFTRADGSLSGFEWTANIPDFFQEEAGQYSVVVTLFDAQGNAAAPCSANLSID